MPHSPETQLIHYKETGRFSKIILDYLEGSALHDFYKHPVDLQGIKDAIADRNKFKTDRELLVEQLLKQYSSVPPSDKILSIINTLREENTYTICTAHQPNIFTGHLYFIYKIIHVIKLADQLRAQLPGSNFVPVFYMGSEDADLEELGHIYLSGVKYEWKTKQKGAVGRMLVDKELVNMLDEISGQINVLPFGIQVINQLKENYQIGTTIELATFRLLHSLFEEYGLIILLPDNKQLKNSMLPVFENELFENQSSAIVNQSSAALEKEYKAQAYPREINLFYLKNDIRNRIIRIRDHFKVEGTDIEFTRQELSNELKDHPERFSPNVILRGLYQETILPNIVFVGGGGELAYWLQLKSLFEFFEVPYPMLVLRNSFIHIEPKVAEIMEKNEITIVDIFTDPQSLMKKVVNTLSALNLSLEEELNDVKDVYGHIKSHAELVDPTLGNHVSALHAQVTKRLLSLEKKMLKAEKKKFDAEKRQINKIFAALFPSDNLQERVDNFLPYYGKYGKEFFREIYDASLGLEQKFTVIIKN